MNWTEAHQLGDLEAMEESAMSDLIKRDDAPDQIFASQGDDGWRWPRASKFPEQGDRENIKYVRADLLVEENKELTLQLLATSGQAADALDKLAKTVEALRDTTQMLSQCTFTIIRMKGQYFERLELVDKARAVLAELEGKE